MLSRDFYNLGVGAQRYNGHRSLSAWNDHYVPSCSFISLSAQPMTLVDLKFATCLLAIGGVLNAVIKIYVR